MISDIDLLGIRLDAIRHVYRKDAEYTLREICRWYSQRYATPLHEVGTRTGSVDIEDVLKTFYEVRYGEMAEDKLEEEAELLARTEEEELEDQRKADADEAEGWSFARMIERQEAARKAAEVEKVRKAREKQKFEDTRVAGAEEREAPVTRIIRERLPVNEGPLIKDPKGRSLPPPKTRPEATLPDSPIDPTMGITPKPSELLGKRKPLPGQAIITTLDENVKFEFMTDDQLAAETVDPFSVEKPRQSKGKKPPPTKK